MKGYPVVLVLGAGASKPYGFPLGKDLRDRLTGSVNETVDRVLLQRGYGNSAIEEFRDALRFGVHPTIDLFLEKKTNLREIGAFYIAAAISDYERHPNLFPERDWYSALFRALHLDESATDDDIPIAIVSLNYDRSLEHFVRKNIDYNVHHASVPLAHSRRQRLKIVHAHGSLGHYPDVPYGGAASDPSLLVAAAENIRIISDKLDDSTDFQEAQHLLGCARKVIFLGFGYNERTTDALLKEVDREAVAFFGTALNAAPANREAIARVVSERMVFAAPNETCYEFARRIDFGLDDI